MEPGWWITRRRAGRRGRRLHLGRRIERGGVPNGIERFRFRLRNRRAFPIEHVVVKRLSLDELHGEEPLMAVRQQLVQSGQVGMRDVGQRAKLVLQPVKSLFTGPAQRFQRDDAVPLEIERLVNDPERALSQPAFELETRGPPKRFLGRVRHLAPVSVFGTSRSRTPTPFGIHSAARVTTCPDDMEPVCRRVRADYPEVNASFALWGRRKTACYGPR